MGDSPPTGSVPSDNPPAAKRQRIERSEYKCQKCRDRKIKCLPIKRNWEQGERCNKCKEKGEECGPHLRFAEVPVLPQTQTAPNRAGDPRPSPRVVPGSTGLLPSPQTLQAQSHSSPPLGPTTAFLPAPGFQTPQPGLHNFRPDWSPHGHYGPLQVSPLSSTAGSFNPFSPESSQAANVSYSNQFGEQTGTSVANFVSRINKGFASLCHLHDTYEQLLVQRRQISIATPLPLPHERNISAHYDETASRVDYQLGLARAEFTTKLRSQFDDIGLLKGSNKYLFRRLLDYPRKFLRPAEAGREFCDPNGVRIVEIYSETLQELINICDEEGEKDEADEFCLELRSVLSLVPVPESINQRIGEATERQSEWMQCTWSKFEIPPEKKTHKNAQSNIFPAPNLAIQSGFDWYVFREASGAQDARTHDMLLRLPLHIAVQHSNERLLRHLVDTLSLDRLDDRDIFLMTPLLLAALLGHLGAVQILLDAGSDRNATDRSARNALTLACEAGHVKVVALLLDSGFDPNGKGVFHTSTPLYIVACRGILPVAELLLNAGGDPNQKVQGKLPREAASDKGHHNVVKLLLQAEGRSASAAQSRPQNAHGRQAGNRVQAAPNSRSMTSNPEVPQNQRHNSLHSRNSSQSDLLPLAPPGQRLASELMISPSSLDAGVPQASTTTRPLLRGIDTSTDFEIIQQNQIPPFASTSHTLLNDEDFEFQNYLREPLEATDPPRTPSDYDIS